MGLLWNNNVIFIGDTMLKQFLKFYKPYRIIFWGVVAGSCLMAVLDLIFPILVRRMLDIELPEGNMQGIMLIALALFLLYLVNFALIYAINYYGHVMSAGIEHDMRKALFAHLEKQSYRFFDNNKTGQLLSRITSDIAEVSELTFRGPNDLFVCSISMTGTLAILIYMNSLLGSIISVLLLGKAVHSVYINKKMKQLFRQSRVKSAAVSAQAEETLSGIRLVKAFANEELELERFTEKSWDLFSTRKKSFNLLSYFSGSISFFTNVTNILVLAVGGYLISVQQLKFSDFVAYFLYVNLFMKPILRLMVFTEMYQKGMAGFQRFNELMELKPEIEDLPNAICEGNIHGELVFEDVSFGYLENKYVLHNFSLTIKPGEKVAFVGTTGAGKTTLAHLLLRFYEPQKGSIKLDGIDIKEYSQAFLHNNIGLVQQDVFLFSDSVKYNVAYGKQEATQTEIVAASELAAADEFIQELPDGYDTEIGERGVKLSGGQKQRIAIARAFLKNPPILVLDEATSALDMKTEKKVQASLDRLAENRTTLIIAHRLSTIMNADKIIVLQNGEIVEQGKHQELLEKNGVYKRLYTSSQE